MRTVEELEVTANNSVYRKLYKAVVCKKTGKCSRCPWHGGENLPPYKKFGVKKKRKSYRGHSVSE